MNAFELVDTAGILAATNQGLLARPNRTRYNRAGGLGKYSVR